MPASDDSIRRLHERVDRIAEDHGNRLTRLEATAVRMDGPMVSTVSDLIRRLDHIELNTMAAKEAAQAGLTRRQQVIGFILLGVPVVIQGHQAGLY